MGIENPFNKPSEEKKSEEIIEGDNFVIMRGKDAYPKHSSSADTSVEFRPGESNEGKIKAKEDAHEKELERIKDFTPLDFAEEFFADMLKYKNPYSETFIIKDGGKFDKVERLDGSPVHMQEANTPEELYQLAQDIQKKHPEYRFSFENDPEGKWMKYTVSKSEAR